MDTSPARRMLQVVWVSFLSLSLMGIAGVLAYNYLPNIKEVVHYHNGAEVVMITNIEWGRIAVASIFGGGLLFVVLGMFNLIVSGLSCYIQGIPLEQKSKYDLAIDKFLRLPLELNNKQKTHPKRRPHVIRVVKFKHPIPLGDSDFIMGYKEVEDFLATNPFDTMKKE